jgi:hypothetical protein
MSDKITRLVQSIRGETKKKKEQHEFNESMEVKDIKPLSRSEQMLKMKIEEMRKKKKPTPGYE